MGARHKARKRALDILFEADQRGQSIDAVLTERAARGEGIGNPYTETLVTGVVDHRAEIDELIEAHAIDWTLDRMPAVDRSLLRLGHVRAAVGGRHRPGHRDRRSRGAGQRAVDRRVADLRQRGPRSDRRP